MQRTTDPKTLNRDGYSMTLSLPRALMAMSIFSFREALIISKIINLSSKYVDKGGCNLTNEQLAKRHRCSKPTVANAISKAKWLGLQEARSDETKTFKTDNGDTAYIQNRRLKMSIPQVWEFFGEVWGEFYFNGCPAAEIMLDWLDEKLPDMESNENGEYLDSKKLLDQFHNQFFTDEGLKELDKKSTKGGVLKIINPHLENYKSPFEKLYALYVSGLTFSDLRSRTNSDPSGSDNVTDDNPSHNGEEEPTEEERLSPQERAKQFLPQSETLANIIRSTKNIKVSHSKLKSWANEIRKLVETDGVDPSRIDSVLSWYSENVGGEYVPVVESGAALRGKFIKLEDAIQRGNDSKFKQGKKPSQGVRSGRVYHDHNQPN